MEELKVEIMEAADGRENTEGKELTAVETLMQWF